MKKLVSLLVVFVLSSIIVGCSKVDSEKAIEQYGCDTLNVFNWGEYIGENTLSNFEKEFGVKVNYTLFDSNEAMYTKLLSGNEYDILVPSDYMIERLIQEDLLQPIDKSIITNIDNLYSGAINKAYDPDNTYSVPYFWGNVGIVYDKTIVDENDVKSQEWDVLKNTKYKGQIYMYDSERDSFMVALKALGYSMNTFDENEINAAYQWLTELATTMDPAYVTDEAIDGLITGEKAMGVMYSGDAAYILSENENMAFYAPEKAGTNMWNDGFVIPKNSKCSKLANIFINYMLEEEIALDNSSTVGYTSSVESVINELAGDDGLYYGISAYTPRVNNAKDEEFKFNEAQRKLISELWVKVKNH